MMASGLNPEAPEFHPLPEQEVTAITEDGYKHLQEASKVSKTFPIGGSYDMYRTYTGFDIVISQIRKLILIQCEKVVVVEVPSATIRLDYDDDNTENIINVSDNLIDRVNGNMDTMSGENRPSTSVVHNAQPAAWNRTPVLTTVKVKSGSASLMSARNIPRPQLSFKEPVDNSDRPFVPRLHDKPNSLKPLALTMLYDDAGDHVGYEHPYGTELAAYAPPEWALRPPPAPAFPAPLDATPLTIVETTERLESLLAHLDTVTEIAVDVEHHSYRSYQGIACLIQISTDEGGDFIVDALALRDRLNALNRAFTDPAKIKVFHGAEQDVRWLQRDFGVYVVGMFDTHRAARLLRRDRLALKHLLHEYCGIEADKTHQLADWRMRPLPEELVKYARGDTHYLLYVWRRMRLDLLQRDPELLRTAFRDSAEVSLLTYSKPTLTADSHMAAYARSGERFTRAQMGVLRTVWAWRDRHARDLDESTGYLMPDRLVLAVAAAMPRDLQGLRALLDPAPPFLKNRLDELHLIVLACRELPEEPQPPSALAAPPPPPVTREPRHPLRLGLDVERAHDSFEDDVAAVGSAQAPDARAFTAPPPTRSLPESRPAPAGDPPVASVDPVAGKKSQLNAEASTFVPPYQRYKLYRVMAQAEELKELKEKEAKVAALGRGSAVVREEVLPQLERARADRDLPSESPAAEPAARDHRDRQTSRAAAAAGRAVALSPPDNKNDRLPRRKRKIDPKHAVTTESTRSGKTANKGKEEKVRPCR